jgi:hypothetical protein
MGNSGGLIRGSAPLNTGKLISASTRIEYLSADQGANMLSGWDWKVKKRRSHSCVSEGGDGPASVLSQSQAAVPMRCW